MKREMNLGWLIGWMVAGVVLLCGARASAVVQVYAQTPHASGGVLTAGLMRPAQALGALAAMGVPVPPTLGSARWVERVWWEGSLAEPGRLMIDLSIDLKAGMGVSR